MDSSSHGEFADRKCRKSNFQVCEGSVVQKASTKLSSAAPFGLFAEFVGFAVSAPTYYFTHLLTSPTVMESLSPLQLASAVSIPRASLASLPRAALLSHMIPAFGMIATKVHPTGSFLSTSQFWLLARLLHPLFLVPFLHRESSSMASALPVAGESTQSLNRAYNLAFGIAVSTHIFSVAKSLWSSFSSHSSPKDGKPGSNLGIKSLFWPPRSWGSNIKPVKTVAEGVLAFLQWDEMVTCVSTLAWSFSLNRLALEGHVDREPLRAIILKTAGMVVLGGPAAASVWLLRTRDQVLLHAAGK